MMYGKYDAENDGCCFAFCLLFVIMCISIAVIVFLGINGSL